VLLAFALALLGLYRRRLGDVAGLASRVLSPPFAVLKELHSGVIGDYVMWVVVGTALIGGVWAVTLR